MGFPIAARLLDRGDPVVFHARRADVAAALTNLGATRAESLKALAETSDVVILCVYDEAQVRQVCLGEDGLLSHLSPGSILINHTTCDPNTLQLLDEQAEATGVGVVDAALSGSPADIGEGHLTLWVGGRPDLLRDDRSDHAVVRRPGDPCRDGRRRPMGEARQQRVVRRERGPGLFGRASPEPGGTLHRAGDGGDPTRERRQSSFGVGLQVGRLGALGPRGGPIHSQGCGDGSEGRHRSADRIGSAGAGCRLCGRARA